LDYFGARYYSGAQGRFLSVDPENASAKEEDPQSWNAYAYTRNNPLKYTDPDGRRYVICPDSGSCIETSDAEFQTEYWLNPEKKKVKGSYIGIGSFYSSDGKLWHYRQIYDDLDGRIESDFAANATIGAIFAVIIKSSVSLLDSLFGPKKIVTEKVTEQIVVNGTKESIRKALDEGAVDSAQNAAIKRALNKGAANAEYSLEKLADGSVRIITKRAGNDGYQAFEKVIDKSGNTTSVLQKAFNSAGKEVHYHPH
jgi:hypothetical protein